MALKRRETPEPRAKRSHFQMSQLEVPNQSTLKNNSIHHAALDPKFHEIPTFDSVHCMTSSLQQRIRYTFDFCATKDGQAAMLSRVYANLQFNRAVREAVSRRVEINRAQLNYLLQLPHGLPGSINSAEEMEKAVTNVKETLQQDEFWQSVAQAEVDLSNTAFYRVKVAGTARELLRVEFDGMLNEKGFEVLEKYYIRYQELRDEMVDLLRFLLGAFGNYSCLERHRNELWDVLEVKNDVDQKMNKVKRGRNAGEGGTLRQCIPKPASN